MKNWMIGLVTVAMATMLIGCTQEKKTTPPPAPAKTEDAVKKGAEAVQEGAKAVGEGAKKVEDAAKEAAKPVETK